MFDYKSLSQQLVIERKKNAALQAQVDKSTSDIDYIAMMSDIEIENGGETEVKNDEQI